MVVQYVGCFMEFPFNWLLLLCLNVPNGACDWKCLQFPCLNVGVAKLCQSLLKLDANSKEKRIHSK